jgi:acetate kinase
VNLLAINAGSSSIKYAVFRVDGGVPSRRHRGRVDRLEARAGTTTAPFVEAAEEIVRTLRARGELESLAGIGHRVVHSGVRPLDHQRVTPELLEELRAARPLDLAHLPAEIALIEAFGTRFPALPQVACFDTAFHRGLPRRAQQLPIPRRFDAAGVRRLGFHGLSYAYLLEELARTAGADAARGRVILAHLGAGASLAAVHEGRPLDTSMAFTPSAGLVMATRPGDLDPGVLVYLQRTEGLDADALDELVSRGSGLLGVSGTTGDMQDLLARRESDARAAEAVDLFCYQARKWIGAFAAALGGLDTLVFSGGIGENAPAVRAQICDGLGFLGLNLDPDRNRRSDAVISSPDSQVTARTIRTDEELMVVRIVQRILHAGDPP